ncbi:MULTISPECIES: M3 family oligoendopeptidase [unclassified Paenibacillus]|uniref:M3 family oligoendopeptidase n=1 Tax=unclassified Paenibacillus TaxID=185978 RepID=UPI0024071A9B|nr:MULTISPECIES: M3 family oligoendopeptidase [unclassified Paenibacillus]MDF9842327.1 M3 family oligoendopeptidase [Paenibacillus sp. PastF-2]MDF9848796.1 M3 family oligoendopeptidase [Paenibacillus sp. PastM-2]MDF9855366.1 M3 family oligoendopeptidase [Paenibacillus sp. PastF-1]MDH6480758.1 M3 family oligoendopeptidase [Paenibacillus sp. PastH-2]MDH6508061.1 M3 family oligoendopeptidase [Paenibacillus sp. PastM-3]
MKFTEYPYERPDVDKFKQEFTALLKGLEADSLEEQKASIVALNELRSEFDTLQSIVYVRHSINTADEFYKAEQDYFDEIGPIFQEYITEYYRAIVNSRYKAEFEQEWGTQLISLAEISLRTFSPDIIEDMQQENRLSTEYTQLLASAKIMFEGEERTLAQLIPFEQSADREVRKAAFQARFDFMSAHESEFDRIYDELVAVRAAMARKLGYPSFVELGYDRMNRTDYNAGMVANFRKQVLEHIVPAAGKLKQRQSERLGLDKLKFYDEGLTFNTGNASPKGDPEWIVANGARMYKELSPETDEFFRFMQDNALMDLLSTSSKQFGGYCTYFEKYKAPFIFSNFNGTSEDIDVLTHEVGHAFQVYSSRSLNIPEYAFPTYEAAEIHSMSMEFFAWPWMNLFFEEDADKYRFNHLAGSLEFVPYGVAVDEFQHFVYSHPEATPQERKQAWREIEQRYLPHRDYDGNSYLEQGSFWHKQSHIFRTPFYYIDYTLAQLCAFQFWKRSNENFAEAWSDYLQLCKAGGSKSFVELVELAGLISPFKDGCVSSVIGEIESWLDSIDDKAL